MDKKTFLTLLDKYLNGQISLEEERFLNAYYAFFSADSDVIDLLSDTEKEKLKLDIRKGIDEQIFDFSKKNISLWTKLGAAAAILVFLFSGLYFLYLKPDALERENVLAMEKILPGKKTATLTLASGKKIYIADVLSGKVGVESGVKITKSADGELIYTVIATGNNAVEQTLTTYKGETQPLVLSDGTKIWLNAASKLVYMSSYTGLKSREVKLEGEAYFEVAKDATRPFRVINAKQTLEVLGTHFNVSAYSDEQSLKTTLLEGKVLIKSAGTAQELILKPGEQADLESNTLKASIVDTDFAVAWKNGEFAFKNEDLRSVMRKVSRWYDVEIIYGSDANLSATYSGTVSRFDNISKVLNILHRAGDLNFKVDGRRILVTD